MRRPHWLLLLVFIFSYKLADAFLGIMANPFYLEAGFSKTDIADMSKLYGFFATIAGGFLGAWMVKKWGLFATLWIGGVACAFTNVLFIPLITSGPDRMLLASIITFDNAGAGVAATALVAFMSALCRREYTATQYAMLTSLFTAARTLSSTPAGWVAENVGWEAFFLLSAALALPGLLALALLQRRKISV
jgi:PAT family beta-lactamase induction signal transducer AmpG